VGVRREAGGGGVGEGGGERPAAAGLVRGEMGG
jgi:hypothetical protein